MFLHNVGPIFFSIFEGGPLLEGSAFLASKMGNGPLLVHGPVIEILRYHRNYSMINYH